MKKPTSYSLMRDRCKELESERDKLREIIKKLRKELRELKSDNKTQMSMKHHPRGRH